MAASADSGQRPVTKLKVQSSMMSINIWELKYLSIKH